MDKRSRAWKIYQAGLAEFNDEYGDMLKPLAAMIDYATAKPKPRKKRAAERKCNVSPQVAFEIIKESGAVDCEPIDPRWFGRLGKELELLQLHEADVQTISDYLANGGWVGRRPNFGTLLKYLSAVAGRALSSEQSNDQDTLRRL